MFSMGGPGTANHKYFRVCAPTSWQYKSSTTTSQSTDEAPCDDPDPGSAVPIRDLIREEGGLEGSRGIHRGSTGD